MSYVDRIIIAFGGVRPMAASIGKPVSTVHSWKVRGSIPDAAKPDVLSRALKMGLPLTREHFFPDTPTPATEGGSDDAAA